MNKNPSFEARLLRSMDEAVAIHRGEAKAAREYALPMTARRAIVAEPEPIEAADIVALRRTLGGWSQAVLAKAMDVSLGTVRNWEQGVRAPEGPARRLLAIARRRPEVLRALVGVTDVGGGGVASTKPSAATAKAKKDRPTAGGVKASFKRR